MAGTIEKLRAKDEKELKVEELSRADKANKRTFGAYVDEIEAAADRYIQKIADIEKAAAYGKITTADFESLITAKIELAQLKEQASIAKDVFTEWFGVAFRQEV